MVAGSPHYAHWQCLLKGRMISQFVALSSVFPFLVGIAFPQERDPVHLVTMSTSVILPAGAGAGAVAALDHAVLIWVGTAQHCHDRGLLALQVSFHYFGELLEVASQYQPVISD
jgi:hypothetical protein